MKASLQLAINQQLTLTPQLQQAIRLLQLSTQDLNLEIQQALESNPMLELSGNDNSITIVKKGSVSAAEKVTTKDQEFHQNYASAPNRKSSNTAVNYEQFVGTEATLADHLIWQLDLSPTTDEDYIIACAIIDATNSDGFLSQSPDKLFESLSVALPELEMDEFQAVRTRIMHFEPLGVGAANLSECLLVQLNQLPLETPYLELAKQITRDDIEALGHHNYRLLMKKYHISSEELDMAIQLIQTLNPRPGSEFCSEKPEYVVPDVVVNKINGHYEVRLNQDVLPKLAINNHYASMIQRADNSKDNTFLKNNLQEARWFLKSIQSRQETLLKVAATIVNHQHAFFELGEEAMKPLILNDVAEILEMHESTISRVTTNKYIHTPRGVFELKYFFSSHLSTKGGGECSSTAIRALLKKLIANEKPQKPLSDNKLAQILKEQGIKIARRTIAKYREAMGIPPSNERKRLTNK